MTAISCVGKQKWLMNTSFEERHEADRHLQLDCGILHFIMDMKQNHTLTLLQLRGKSECKCTIHRNPTKWCPSFFDTRCCKVSKVNLSYLSDHELDGVQSCLLLRYLIDAKSAPLQEKNTKNRTFFISWFLVMKLSANSPSTRHSIKLCRFCASAWENYKRIRTYCIESGNSSRGLELRSIPQGLHHPPWSACVLHI